MIRAPQAWEWPVTPEVAGSSPVAPVPRKPSLGAGLGTSLTRGNCSLFLRGYHIWVPNAERNARLLAGLGGWWLRFSPLASPKVAQLAADLGFRIFCPSPINGLGPRAAQRSGSSSQWARAHRPPRLPQPGTLTTRNAPAICKAVLAGSIPAGSSNRYPQNRAESSSSPLLEDAKPSGMGTTFGYLELSRLPSYHETSLQGSPGGFDLNTVNVQTSTSTFPQTSYAPSQP